jgi:uncharacterized protein YceK
MAMLKKILVPILVSLAGCQSVNTTQPGTVGVDRQQNMLVSSSTIKGGRMSRRSNPANASCTASRRNVATCG